MTKTSTDQARTAPGAVTDAARTRWIALAFVGLAQLMLQFNSNVVVIALPSAQQSLSIPDSMRAWVLGIYSLAFGGMLMAGGRIVDRFGRKRTMVLAMAGFVIASAVGGAAQTTMMLIIALAAQGVFAAVQNPAQLATITTTFTDPAERGKAFSYFGLINTAGGTIGFLLSGVITDSLGWRWCLFLSVPLGLIAMIGAMLVLKEGPAGERKPFDVPGAVLVTASMLALAYGLSEAGKHGWGDGTTVGLLIGGLVLLIVFIVLQTKVKHPLMPMRVLLDRNRGGANLVMLLISMQILSMNFFLTYFAQNIKHFTPAETGLTFLPLTAGLLVTNSVVGKIAARFRPRSFVLVGMLVYALAYVWLTQVSAEDSYWSSFLPAMVVMGLGIGCMVAPVYSTATAGVDPGDAGAAGGIVGTGRQMGAALGLALSNTIATLVTSSFLEAHPGDEQARVTATVHGFNVAAAWAAGLLVFGAIVGFLLMNAPKPEPGKAGHH
ncbi:MFS transporter [Amycolatopsis samaneae]|uniref:MFS transporter n=1 Tax=Amycolatopsis samaneae TaxID=664691 RepID=A0ABW5GRQ8_9PSEU